MTILILAEHDNASVKPATLATIAAAKQLGQAIHVLVLGQGVDQAAAQAQSVEGVEKVIVGDNASFDKVLAENFAAAVLSIASDYDYILAPATTFGKNILPRIAAKLDIQQISDIIAVNSPKEFMRPIFAGNAIETLETNQAKNVITVRPTAFNAVALGGGNAAVEKKDFAVPASRSSFVSLQESKSDRPELTSARIVVSGGRGVGSKENFKVIEELADELNAAIGASRAAVDAGYVPNDYQVGQTGKIIAPDLYVAFGISGAIQHLAGIGGAKTIVAINKDPDAPIFQVADYGLVGDLFQIIPELRDALKK
jgi:electron transfer flavoprotein alpha subunit